MVRTAFCLCLLLLASGPAILAEPPRVDAEGVTLPPGVLMRLGSSRMRHSGTIFAVAWSSDGQLIATGGADGFAIWNANTGKLLQRVTSDQHYVDDLRFSTDGRKLDALFKVGGADNPRCVFKRVDIATGRIEFKTEPTSDANSYTARISGSGKRFAVSCVGKPVRLFTTDIEGDGIAVPINQALARGLDFAPDERSIAVADFSDTITVHDTTDGHLLSNIKQEAVHFAGVRFSPDGQEVAAIAFGQNRQNSVGLWEVVAKKKRISLPLPDGLEIPPSDICFSPDGRFVAVYGQAMPVLICDRQSGKEVRRIPRNNSIVWRTCFSPDAQSIAVVNNNGTVQIWNVSTGQLHPASADPMLGVFGLRFENRGRRLIGASEPIAAWDTQSGQQLRRFPAIAPVWGPPVLSPDGKLIAGRDPDGSIRVCDSTDGHTIHRLHHDNSYLCSFVFTPDSRELATIEGGRAILVFNLSDGRLDFELPCDHAFNDNLLMSPDGTWLASAHRDLHVQRGASVRIWDLQSHRELRHWMPQYPVRALTVSENGDQIATSGNARTETGLASAVQLWDARTGKLIRGFGPQSDIVNCLALSADQRMLVTGGDDKTVRLWEIATGGERQAISGHRGVIQSVAISSDSQLLAASSADAPVFLWDLFNRAGQPKRPPTAAELDQDWATLASADAKAAYQSICRLVAAPEPGVAFLRDRLKPAIPANAAKVRNLIQQLDSPTFAERQKAEQELERFSDQAENNLLAAQRATQSPEVREALRRLLRRLETPTGEMLRGIRAVEILEYAATPSARDLLKALAAGAPGAHLTEAAAAALKRLAK
jgi:WD40 repeat protein